MFPLRHNRVTLWYHRLKKPQGYRFGVLCCAVISAVVFIINLILTVCALLSSEIQNGLGTLQNGSCKTTGTLTFWIHLIINILSTFLLGASNYSMQCLSSPTRNEVDKAHDQGTWMDIGVPSLKNLQRLSTYRKLLWWLLAISSIPLHLLYNSAIFSSLGTRQFNIFLVSEDFLDGGAFDLSGGPGLHHPNLTDPSIVESYQKQTSLARLENKACVETYSATTISSYSDLLLVCDYLSPDDNSLISFDSSQRSPLVSDGHYNGVFCSMSTFDVCTPSNIKVNPENWIIDVNPEQLPKNPTAIQYCLGHPVEERCKLQFSLAILIVVIVCNLMETICMCVIVRKRDPEPLVTLGDAIASFLDRPDVTTEGNCIVGKTRFESRRYYDLLASRWDPRHWFQAASSRRWLVCTIL